MRPLYDVRSGAHACCEEKDEFRLGFVDVVIALFSTIGGAQRHGYRTG